MGKISLLAGILLFLYSLQQYGLLIDGCQTKYIANATSGYRCSPYYGGDVGTWQMNVHTCIWKCLSKSACRYINHNQGTRQCFIGLGVSLSLEPAPGFLFKAFEPTNYSCLYWGSHNEPGRLPVQMHDGGEMLHVSRVAHNGNLIPGKCITIGQGFWCSIEGGKSVLGASKTYKCSRWTIPVNCHGFTIHPERNFSSVLWLADTWLTTLFFL